MEAKKKKKQRLNQSKPTRTILHLNRADFPNLSEVKSTLTSNTHSYNGMLAGGDNHSSDYYSSGSDSGSSNSSYCD